MLTKKTSRNVLSKLILIAAFFLLSTATLAFAEEKEIEIEARDDGIYIDNISTEELEIILKENEYNMYIYMPGWKYPPLFLQHMPYDFAQIEDTNKRINLFIRLMIPLALKANQDILSERLELLEIIMHFEENTFLTEEQMKRVDEIAEKYDSFTRFKGLRRYSILLYDLETKINIIPPSILVANAAIETGWGTSKALMEGNSLYKEVVWYSDEGIDPEDPEDNTYRIKIFPTLSDSINSFALKINSNINYSLFRASRTDNLARHGKLDGRYLSNNLYYNTNLENFLGLIDYTITFYDMTSFDKGILGYPDENDYRLPSLEEQEKMIEIINSYRN